MELWRIARREPGKFEPDDLRGIGAYLYGGRWNSKGVHAVYASFHPATAVLETLAHLGRNRGVRDRYLVRITLADAIAEAGDGLVKARALPAEWAVNPPHQASQLYGDAWLARKRGQQLGLILPSALIREESNVLLNPAHPAMAHVKARIVRPFVFDERLEGLP